MPPKKKGKKKKKKDGDELTIDDKYKQTLDEIEALKDHLAVRKEVARRAKSAGSEFRNLADGAETKLEKQAIEHKAVSSDMTRQYKTMQTEMGLRIHHLEVELTRTKSKLETAEADLKKVKEERDRQAREKDQKIAELSMQIDSMGLQYESVLHGALDDLVDKLKASKSKWEDKSTMIQTRNKQVLLEFGLNPLDL